jgi:hypothetical protein
MLFLIALVNLIAARSPVTMLDQPDLILQLSSRRVLVIWAALDLVISAWLLAGRELPFKMWLIGFLTTILVVYQTGLSCMGAPNFSECLGNLYDWFTVSPRMLGAVMWLILGYALIGSYAFMILNWRVSRNSRRKAAALGTPTVR